MSKLTEQAIKESFVKLLNEKPLSKITVKDIVEDCGINRNSFYYHFQDIPSLTKEIVTENAEEIISRYPEIDTIEQCMDALINFAMNNRRAALHIYNSANRNILEHYLSEVCGYVVNKYINNILRDKKINDADKEILIRFYKCECFGQIVEWMNNGMRDDLAAQVHRICEIRQGIIDLIISRCMEH